MIQNFVLSHIGRHPTLPVRTPGPVRTFSIPPPPPPSPFFHFPSNSRLNPSKVFSDPLWGSQFRLIRPVLFS